MEFAARLPEEAAYISIRRNGQPCLPKARLDSRNRDGLGAEQRTVQVEDQEADFLQVLHLSARRRHFQLIN